jgi:hypothetical protein
MNARPPYGAIFALTLIAALTTACLSAPGLATWADALPDSAAARLASSAAHALADATTRLGLSRPADALHNAIRRAEAARFTQQQDQ